MVSQASHVWILFVPPRVDVSSLRSRHAFSPFFLLFPPFPIAFCIYTFFFHFFVLIFSLLFTLALVLFFYLKIFYICNNFICNNVVFFHSYAIVKFYTSDS